MKIIVQTIGTIFFLLLSVVSSEECKQVSAVPKVLPKTACVNFQVSSGTGCSWMCDYCNTQLGTTNYYFTDNVCTYETGGCQGNPIAGKTYTCCSN